MKLASLLVVSFTLLIAACAVIDYPDVPPHEPAQKKVTLQERLENANSYDNHGLAAQAEEEYKAALLMAPNDLKILTNLVRISSALHHYDDAETYGLKALEIEPGKADILNYLAWMEVIARKNYAAAHDYIDRAIDAKSEQKPFYMEGKGLFFMEQQRFEEAISAFKATLAEISRSQLTNKPRAVLEIDIYKNMGRAYRSLGREQDAKESLRKALDIATAMSLPLTPE